MSENYVKTWKSDPEGNIAAEIKEMYLKGGEVAK